MKLSGALKVTAGVVTLIACLGVLSSCQSNPPVEGPPVTAESIAQRDAELAALRPWRALGAFVVNSDKQGVVNASFAWDSHPDGFDIKLFGPLGVQAYQVREKPTGAMLVSKEGEVTGESAELLLLQALGVLLPMRNMQDWIVGLQGNANRAERDRSGLLRELLVAGQTGDEQQWDVRFQRYTRFNNLDVPKTILVSGDGIEIRVSVKKWIRLDPVPNGRLTVPGIDS